MKRILVTLSNGSVHVDYCPEDVTVEVRDFDNGPEDGDIPTAYEIGHEGLPTDVTLVDDGTDTWRRLDRARPEFDGHIVGLDTAVRTNRVPDPYDESGDYDKWARNYDDLNGAPESEEDR